MTEDKQTDADAPANADEGAGPEADLRKQNPGQTVAPDAGAAAADKSGETRAG